MIELEGIGKTYGIPGSRTGASRSVLTDFNLTIHEGEFLSVIGPSGCGKSTLLNILAGLEVPNSGRLTLRGVESAGKPGPDRAVVFQEAGLLPWLTVLGNVEYGLKLQKVGKAERREQAIEALKLVHLYKHRDAYPHQLSGGMRQRGSIARALALKPSVLLMDEPFSALDAQTRDLLHDELQQLWIRTGVTVVFITHNLAEAVYLSSRVLVMTAPPGRIKSIVNVPFGFPRSKSSPDLAAFAANLHQSIREEVDRVAAQELDEGWTGEQPTQKPADVDFAEGI